MDSMQKMQNIQVVQVMQVMKVMQVMWVMQLIQAAKLVSESTSHWAFCQIWPITIVTGASSPHRDYCLNAFKMQNETFLSKFPDGWVRTTWAKIS